MEWGRKGIPKGTTELHETGELELEHQGYREHRLEEAEGELHGMARPARHGPEYQALVGQRNQKLREHRLLAH